MLRFFAWIVAIIALDLSKSNPQAALVVMLAALFLLASGRTIHRG